MIKTLAEILTTVFGSFKVFYLFYFNLVRFVELTFEKKLGLVVGFTTFSFVFDRFVASHISNLIDSAFSSQREIASKMAGLSGEVVVNDVATVFDMFYEVASSPIISELHSVLLLFVYLISFYISVAIWLGSFKAANEEKVLYVVLIAFIGVSILSQALWEAIFLVSSYHSQGSDLDKWRLFRKQQIYALSLFLLFLGTYQIYVLRKVYLPKINLLRYILGLLAIPIVPAVIYSIPMYYLFA